MSSVSSSLSHPHHLQYCLLHSKSSLTELTATKQLQFDKSLKEMKYKNGVSLNETSSVCECVWGKNKEMRGYCRRIKIYENIKPFQVI